MSSVSAVIAVDARWKQASNLYFVPVISTKALTILPFANVKVTQDDC
jgi:hypothetical protein